MASRLGDMEHCRFATHWLDSASYYTGRPDVRVMFFKDGVHDGFADICRTEETKGACKVMEV